jgi:hypothetical protein
VKNDLPQLCSRVTVDTIPKKGGIGVQGMPSWLKAAISKRIDALGQRMHVHPRHKDAWKQIDEWFEKLQASFSEEQHRQFVEWEERMSLQESKEKEELYVRGFLDGFQMYASLDECLDQMHVEAINKKEVSPY